VTDAPDLRTLSYDLSKNLGFQATWNLEEFFEEVEDDTNSYLSGDDNLAESTTIDHLNVFDAKVLIEAMRISYFLVLMEYEKVIQIFSEWNQHFQSFWIGERSNQ